MSVDDVWVTWTLNGWNVACEARALPFYYKTQEAAIRFGTILAKLRRCDLFVEGEYHPARSSGDSRRNLEKAFGTG